VDPSFGAAFVLPSASAHYVSDLAAALPANGLLVAPRMLVARAVRQLSARMAAEFSAQVGESPPQAPSFLNRVALLQRSLSATVTHGWLGRCSSQRFTQHNVPALMSHAQPVAAYLLR
jgi:hypothetical protein